eukprot:233952-Pleurochrysis_carterae.AAC.1
MVHEADSAPVGNGNTAGNYTKTHVMGDASKSRRSSSEPAAATTAESHQHMQRLKRQEEPAVLEHLEAIDLAEAQAAFNSGSDERGLSLQEFVEAFAWVCAGASSRQLTSIFMQIDANANGWINWDEFLSFVMLQDKCAPPPHMFL